MLALSRDIYVGVAADADAESIHLSPPSRMRWLVLHVVYLTLPLVGDQGGFRRGSNLAEREITSDLKKRERSES